MVRERKVIVQKLFFPQVRRYGKFLSLTNRPITKNRALFQASQNVLSNLGASFRIVPSKKTLIYDADYKPKKAIDINYKPNPGIFRISTKESIPIYIQKSGSRNEPTVKGARLSSIGEIREIQSSRRKNPFMLISRKSRN